MVEIGGSAAVCLAAFVDAICQRARCAVEVFNGCLRVFELGSVDQPWTAPALPTIRPTIRTTVLPIKPGVFSKFMPLAPLRPSRDQKRLRPLPARLAEVDF